MSGESRRSTAAQFFMEEDASTEGRSTYDRVVDLLNKASLMQRDNQKITNLKVVQELIVHKEIALLDNFLDEMLAFQSDKSADVRKFVVTFIEEGCKKDPEVLAKTVGNLMMLLRDESVAVIKRCILSTTQLYRVALSWVAKAKKLSSEMETTWPYIVQMKTLITEMLDSDNDGIRTHAIKFVEGLCLCNTEKTSDSETPKKAEHDISLDIVPDGHSLLRRKKLEEEGVKGLEALLDFQAASHISSVNLMTCMGSLSTIARQRPQYMARVVQGYEMLHVNLPPTLAKSQVSSVRKTLKINMLQLLKNPSSLDYHPQITTLLTDLGATQSEVMRAMPKIDESRKRKSDDSHHTVKKARVEIPLTKADDDDDYGMTPFVGLRDTKPKPAPSEDQKQSAIDITSEDLIPRLTPQNVTDLVLLSMVMLPESMPASFQATYTPIAAAGTPAQISHLSRLLATQLTAAGLGKGIHQVQGRLKERDEEEEEEEEVEAGVSPKHVIQTLVGGSVAEQNKKLPSIQPPAVMPPPAQVVSSSRKGIKKFNLGAVTRPLSRNERDTLVVSAFRRQLQSEDLFKQNNMPEVYSKLLTVQVCQNRYILREEFQKFIFEDLRNRADLAFAWIYQEYAYYKGFVSPPSLTEKQTIASYDECLTQLLNGVLERPDQREGLFSRLLLESPYITPNAIMVLRKYCQDETRIYLGMTTLKELIVKRPCLKLEFLDVLLDFTTHEKPEVRNTAILVVKDLHERSDLHDPIEKSALYYLKFLLFPSPPQELYGIGKGRTEVLQEWNDDNIKLCLYLYLGLLPINHKLIHELAKVYTGTTPEIKRAILRAIEGPVKVMGMHSPELLLLVETFPKGAETLVTRIIQLLTDKVAPSVDLVERVRDLYHKRVSDVRFLIPVLSGLTKKEVIAVLPKLIKINPAVVKEAFNRLLGNHDPEGNYSNPLTPAELLVALHNIDSNKCDMKTIIKATNLCFAERGIYTQEVLALVMQQLMEQNPLPTLLMRTVLQSLAMYNKLLGLVMNILQRLITKQVWKQKKVWEGFVKCCERTKPQSFQVLLQLPAAQLKNAFEISPDLREPLLNHVQSFTPIQQACIPRPIMQILERDPMEEEAKAAREAEEKRLAAQELMYKQKLEEERKKQQQQAEEERIKQEQVKKEQEAAAQLERSKQEAAQLERSKQEAAAQQERRKQEAAAEQERSKQEAAAELERSKREAAQQKMKEDLTKVDEKEESKEDVVENVAKLKLSENPKEESSPEQIKQEVAPPSIKTEVKETAEEGEVSEAMDTSESKPAVTSPKKPVRTPVRRSTRTKK